MRKTLPLLAALLFTLVSSLSMACERPVPPELPDPATAVTPQMVKAKNDVKAFVTAADAYLKCKISNKEHDAMVDEMHSVADKFNKVVQEFKTRMAG